MAKGFQIDGNDFDVLFEAPYTNFGTVTFSGVSPTCKYCTRYFGDNPNGGTHYYAKNGTKYDASPRGFLPSNYKVATVTTTGRWMKIQRESTGFSVNGTTYRNSNRGSYPINRVGLVFCGGGAGGAGGGSSITADGDSYYFDWAGGNGGGGGATVAVTLWLDKYTYYIYLGAGGAGGDGDSSSSSGGKTGGNGGASYLRLTSSSGTLLVTANGGKAGGNHDDSTATINNGNYFTTVGTAKGSGGGNGGMAQGYSDPVYGGYLDFVLDADGSFNSGSIAGYLSQQVSGSRISMSGSGKSAYYNWTGPDGSDHQMGGGGGGVSAMGTYGGNGGDANETESWGEPVGYVENGANGQGGVAWFYY